MKEKWFQYLVENKKWWPHGFTLKRLEKIKDLALSDEDILWDLLERHGGSEKTPEQMLQDDKSCFDHGMGNFVGNILSLMIEKQIYKP